MVTILAVIVVGYLLGSTPSGVLASRIFKGFDIREHGSKSAGATNVFRVLGWKLAIIVLILDVAKGYVACLVSSGIDFGDIVLSSNQLAMIGGIAAIFGHLFPVFAGFKGGKGVATGAGLLLFLVPMEVGFAVLVFVSIVLITRYVSLGSILAATFLSISILIEQFYLKYPHGYEITGLAILILIMVLYTHRGNIVRLIRGTENKFGVKR